MDINKIRTEEILRAQTALEGSYDPFEMVIVENKGPIIEMTPVLDENNFASRNQIRLRVSVESRLRHLTQEEQEEAQSRPKPNPTLDKKTHDLHVELTQLLNRVSRESESNTPDYILSDYMINCLEAFERATARRAEWYGEALG